MSSESAPDKLSIIVYDHHFDKVHYALVMAAAAAAIGRPVTLFFTMGASVALLAAEADQPPAWADMPVSDNNDAGLEADHDFGKKGIGRFEELLEACQTFGVRFMVCEMGLRAKGLKGARLRSDLDIEVSGVVTFMDDASRDGAMIFI